ncbi:MAG: HAD family hydrolase [Planctomycetaceae bacterium]
MLDPIAEIIRRLAKPLAPEPTGETPVLRRLHGVKAVLFDIYGTLFVSASGDVVATASKGRDMAFAEAAAICGLVDLPDAATVVDRLDGVVGRRHETAKSAGIEYPEIDVVDVWREVFDDLTGDSPDDAGLRRLAAVYENLVNPVWSMPGCRETLERLRDSGCFLGAVSNSQFYTLPMFEALLGISRNELGIRDDLVHLSYKIGHAKPGRVIFERAATALAEIGVTPRETLYVGNDLLNDVAASSAIGFRTVLFAGDRRSLRKREGDARIEGVTPDAVITELPQLLEVIEMVDS